MLKEAYAKICDGSGSAESLAFLFLGADAAFACPQTSIDYGTTYAVRRHPQDPVRSAPKDREIADADAAYRRWSRLDFRFVVRGRISGMRERVDLTIGFAAVVVIPAQQIHWV
jgi:hypothetical protein